MNRLPFLLAAFLALPLAPDAQLPAPPTPSGHFFVRGGDDPSSLLEVAEAYAQVCGLPLDAVGGSASALAAAPVGLLADVEVPAETVHAFAQGLLGLGGFVILGFDGALRVTQEADAAARAIALDEAAARGLAAHGALLVRASATLGDHLDARQITTSLRTLHSPSAAPAMSARGERVLEVEGPIERVLGLLDALQAAGGGEAARPAGPLLPPPSDPAARFEARPEESVLSLMERYVAATGRPLWVGAELRADLTDEPSGLVAPVACDAARAHTLVEAVLFAHDVSLTARGGHPPTLYAAGRGTSRPLARAVPFDPSAMELDLPSDHPATVFGGAMQLEALEVRQLTTSLRALMSDTHTQAAIALDAHLFYVQGTGARAAELARLLQALEGAAPAPLALEAPPRDAVLAVGATPALTELAAAWSRAGGPGVIATGRAAQAMAEHAVLGAATPLSGAEATARLEQALAELDLTLAVLSSDPPLVLVRHAADAGRGPHRLVSLEELDRLADRGSLLVQVLVPLERLEARQAATRLRGWVTSTTESAIALDDHVLAVGGPVTRVREHVARLLEWNAAGALPEGR